MAETQIAPEIKTQAPSVPHEPNTKAEGSRNVASTLTRMQEAQIPPRETLTALAKDTADADLNRILNLQPKTKVVPFVKTQFYV